MKLLIHMILVIFVAYAWYQAGRSNERIECSIETSHLIRNCHTQIDRVSMGYERQLMEWNAQLGAILYQCRGDGNNE